MIEIIDKLTLLVIPAFLVLDLFIQKRQYAKTKYWRLRGLVVTVGIVLFTGQVAILWGNLYQDFHLLDMSTTNLLIQITTALVAYEFFHYWYHRAAHQWQWLWQASHQMHHSAESLDAFGANYIHPIDAAVFTTIASLVFFPLLGVSIEAAVIATFFLIFNAMFQHANISTPHWLGYLIQRPESHNIHHGKEVHHYNYADLPVLDMLFGTFENPKALANTECGFYPGASSRIIEMLLFKDVTRPDDNNQSLGRIPATNS